MPHPTRRRSALRARPAALLLCALVGLGACRDGSGGDRAEAPDDTLASVAASRPAAEGAGEADGGRDGTTVTSAPGPTGPTSTTTEPAGGAPLDWRPCDSGFECATLIVPWDGGIGAGPAPADGTVMRLPVIRLAATDAGRRIGSVVLNPGGPGGSGVAFLRAAAGAPALKALNQRFDLVSFDPRGVGGAQPALRCRDSLDDDIDVLGPGGTPADAYREELLGFHRRCVADNEALVAVLGTDYVAADLDRLRAALGDETLTYLGFSYGTRLGARYAERYPGRFRALALDGADVSNERYLESIDAQYRSFDAAFERFAASCPADPAATAATECATADEGGAAGAFRTVEAELRREPLPVGTSSRSGRRLTLGELYLGAAAALYDRSGWSLLDEALDNAVAGDGSDLQALADNLLDRRPDGSYGNLFDVNIAVNCADAPQRPTYDEAVRRGAALAAELRWFGPLATTAFVDCVQWPAPRPTDPPPAPPTSGPTLLVVGSTGDPATPYAWAEDLAERLPGGRLLTRVGEGHTGYFASSCVANAINAYLVDPAAGSRLPTTCEP